jgi:hypothetical protein
VREGWPPFSPEAMRKENVWGPVPSLLRRDLKKNSFLSDTPTDEIRKNAIIK